jgi:hypothetical protein
MIRAYAYDYNIFKSIDKFLRYSKSSQKNPTQTKFLYSLCCGSGSGILGEVLYFISFNFLLRILQHVVFQWPQKSLGSIRFRPDS